MPPTRRNHLATAGGVLLSVDYFISFEKYEKFIRIWSKVANDYHGLSYAMQGSVNQFNSSLPKLACAVFKRTESIFFSPLWWKKTKKYVEGG